MRAAADGLMAQITLEEKLGQVAISLLCDARLGSDHPVTAVDGRMCRLGSSAFRMYPTSEQRRPCWVLTASGSEQVAGALIR